ncbi:MAG TPA: DUF748 domain-containing protein [Myxococcales bacterium]|nr:DUF748 domain-containing protein [Myxococcales bacterium]
MRRWTRWPLYVLAALVVLLVAARLALTPFVSKHTHEVLNDLKGYRGDFDHVSVSLWNLSYTIDGLKLVKVPTPPGAARKRPFFYAKRIRIGLHWRDLIHKHELVGNVSLEEPKINLIAGRSESKSQTKIIDPEIGNKISRLSPLDVERVELRKAELTFTDDTGEEHAALWLHDLDATVENLATRVGLQHGEPSTLAASGTLQKTGQVSVFVTADPLSKQMAFSGRASVQGLALRDVGNFLEQKAELAPEHGTIDLFAEFDAHDGHIAGGVKPLLKNVGVKAGKPGLWPKVKSFLADTAIKIFSDRVPGRNAASTVIPIEGRIGGGPQTDVWGTVVAVLRNAFVAGLRSGFGELPQQAAQKAGAAPQARTRAGGHR